MDDGDTQCLLTLRTYLIQAIDRDTSLARSIIVHTPEDTSSISELPASRPCRPAWRESDISVVPLLSDQVIRQFANVNPSAKRIGLGS